MMQRTAEATADSGELPEQYVINLCASTTPMALVQPKSDALKRFTFFVSRRREEGRERFRLHMGYFASAGEADEWLGVVRELYPAAWVGEAPGKKLRAAARAAARPQAPVASVVHAPRAIAPAPAAPPTAPARARAAVPALSNVSEVIAQLDATDNRRAGARTDKAASQRTDETTRSKAAHTLYVPPTLVLPENIPTVQALHPAPAAPKAAPPPRKAMPAPPKAAPTPPKATPAPPKAAPAPPKAAPAPNLSDSQVLRVLEERRADSAPVSAAQTAAERAANAAIALLRPDDTRTMRALKDEVQQNAPVQFAVQLDWSVTPIDLTKVPPLAIFGAYSLYTVESSREGRKWYGLRLGFFSDALSAKQVAFYVRSDFGSVAVVPVSVEEKDRAIDDVQKQPVLPRRREAGKATEDFKLFDADQPPSAPAAAPEVVRAKLAAASANAGKRGSARPKPAPRRKAATLEESLEQTLEILGASDLEIDNGRGELLNDTGVRHLSVKVDRRTSTFSKLLDRLSDRMGNR